MIPSSDVRQTLVAAVQSASLMSCRLSRVDFEERKNEGG